LPPQETVVAVTSGAEVHVLTHTRERPLQPARTVPLPGSGGLGDGARLLRAAWVPQRPRTLIFLVATEPAQPGLAVSTWMLPERAGPAEPVAVLEAALPAAAVAAGHAAHDSDLFAVACEVCRTAAGPFRVCCRALTGRRAHSYL
jgi:hypothetical protein